MKRISLFLAVLLILLSVLTVPAFASVGDGDDDSFDLIDFLLNGLQGLFIPSDRYMREWREDLSERFERKLGGVTGAVGYLHDRMGQLREYHDIDGLFSLRFPKGSFLYGISANMLAPGRDVLYWIRFCMTGFVVLGTAMACYHRAKRMLNR